jgi:hypothetical protein
MILADTSIWIEMFRKGRFKARIGELIARDRLCIHPFVIAELACGTLPQRQKTLANLDELTALPVVNLTEVRFMIEARGLWAKGIGFTDLATPGTQIWTIDGPLGRVAESLGIRAQLP